jgi:hypothetical protein
VPKIDLCLKHLEDREKLDHSMNLLLEESLATKNELISIFLVKTFAKLCLMTKNYNKSILLLKELKYIASQK